MLTEKLTAIWYRLARLVCRLFCRVLFRIRVYGIENVPPSGALVLLSNHQSYLDPILCGVFLKRQLCFLARESLFANRFFRALIKSLGAIPLRQGRADLAAVKTVVAELRRGKAVCLFPEGTRTEDGRIGRIKPGFGLLCRRGKAAVVPMVIDGAFECWPKHRKMFKTGPIWVCYGEPISAEQAAEMGDEKLAEAVTERLRQMQAGLRTKRGKEPLSYSVP